MTKRAMRYIDGIYAEKSKPVKRTGFLWSWPKVDWDMIAAPVKKIAAVLSDWRLPVNWQPNWPVVRKSLWSVLLVGLSSLISVGLIVSGSNLLHYKQGVVYAADSGVIYLKKGVENLKTEKFADAADSFAKAQANFEGLKTDLNNLGQGQGFLQNTIAGDDYQNMYQLVEGLSSLSRGAKLLSLGMNEISGYAGGDFSGLLFKMLSGQDDGGDDFMAVMSEASDYVLKAEVELNAAHDKLAGFDPDYLPAQYQKSYGTAVADAGRYLNILRGVSSILAGYDQFLGQGVPAKYMLLFQNNNEIRPTGGFIGSYGLMTLTKGQLAELKFDDVYNPDGQLSEKIEPPYPLNMLTNSWGLRDSNWNPDFAVSADQAVHLFEKGGGFTVDGVVALTPQIISRYLELTGPVMMTDYGVELNSENFASEAQKEIELDRDADVTKPKQILADLLPVLMERLSGLDSDQKKQMWEILLDLLASKDIMVFSYNQQMEGLLKDLNWSGQTVTTAAAEDYLSVIHANIGGRKSDEHMNREYIHSVSVNSAGEVIVDLQIIKTNQEGWSWSNLENFDYVRVYVPSGSELIGVSGFDSTGSLVIGEEGLISYDQNGGLATLADTKVYEENGKTVFANWLVNKPDQITMGRYRYKLPFCLSDWFSNQAEYKLYLQKQPGLHNVSYKFDFQAPDWRIESAGLVTNGGRISFDYDLETDRQLTINMVKQ